MKIHTITFALLLMTAGNLVDGCRRASHGETSTLMSRTDYMKLRCCIVYVSGIDGM